MTRIHIVSDIHDDASRLHFGNYALPRDIDADVLVIAGDVAGRLSRMGRDWLEAQRRDIPIIVVPGNHDFWRASLDVEVEKMRARLQTDHIHVLDGDTIVIDGTRFVGGTLWTDYAIVDGDAATGMQEAWGPQGMNEFQHIRMDEGTRRATPMDLLDVHRRHRAAIEACLAEPFDGPTVVVTHHAPSARSLQDGRVTHPLDGAYASDLDDLIRQGQPDLWIHGHVHKRQDYEIGATRIVANPRGYVTWGQRWGTPQVVAEEERYDETLVVAVGRDHKPKVVWEHGGEVLDLDELELAAWEEEHRAATRRAQSARDRAKHAEVKARGCGR